MACPNRTQALFGELKRVESSNTTRGYLNTVIKSLTLLPRELVLGGFCELAEDVRVTPASIL